jgi:hypothetical protein
MTEKAHAAETPSQPTPAQPDMSQAPGPAKEPLPKPVEKPPVVTEKPAPQSVTPAPVTPAAPAETPSVAPVEPDKPQPAAPAEPEPANEMPATEETPLESKTEEMGDSFSVPPATPTPAPEATPPAEEPETEEPEEKEEEEPKQEKDSLEDFFNAVPRPSTLKVAGGFQSDSHRTWTDNTGKYHCQARLVSVNSHEAVLSKADGKLKTVALRRLSDEDLQFVHAQVVVKQEMLARQSADGKLASH